MKQWKVDTAGYRNLSTSNRIEGETLKEAVELNLTES